MTSRPPVADVRFAEANAILKSKGLLGWVCLNYGGLQLDCIRVRKDADGGYSLGFPTRTDANGVMHPVYRPLDRASRDEIETIVLGELRRRGKLPPDSSRSEFRTHAPSEDRS